MEKRLINLQTDIVVISEVFLPQYKLWRKMVELGHHPCKETGSLDTAALSRGWQ